MIFNILDNTTELDMTKYIIGEILSSGGATLYKKPSDQTVRSASYNMHTVGFAHVVFAVTNNFDLFSLFQGATSNSSCDNCASENRNTKISNMIFGLYKINWIFFGY